MLVKPAAVVLPSPTLKCLYTLSAPLEWTAGRAATESRDMIESNSDILGIKLKSSAIIYRYYPDKLDYPWTELLRVFGTIFKLIRIYIQTLFTFPANDHGIIGSSCAACGQSSAVCLSVPAKCSSS